MPHYQVFHPDHESLGQNLLDLANAIGANEFLPILAKHGLTNIEPGNWYPQQQQLDALSEIAERQGGRFDLISIGMKLVESAPTPPDFDQLPLLTILQTASEVYALTDRGTDTGEIQCEVVSDNHVKMVLRLPDPDDLWYGITYGYMRRFATPRGIHFTVAYDETVPRRDVGGELTIIHVTWQ